MACLTQAQIAKKLDISQSTVSLVMADPMTKRVSVETRRRILDYVQRMDPSFKPRRRATGDICYLVPENAYSISSIFTRLLDGAEAEAKEEGLNLIFKRWRTVEDFPDIFENLNFSGIIHCGETTEEAIRHLQRFAPTVLLNYTFENMVCNMVTIDNHGAIRQAVRHCYNLGHRRIGFANYQLHHLEGHFLERLGGYYEAMYALSLPIRPEYVVETCRPGRDATQADETLHGLLQFTPSDRPTAMVCANDGIAVAVMKAALAAGLRLPEDLSVVGFDNTETGREWRPALTSIHQKREDMGRAAVALLTRKITEGRADIPEKVLCEAELIVRESVARKNS